MGRLVLLLSYQSETDFGHKEAPELTKSTPKLPDSTPIVTEKIRSQNTTWVYPGPSTSELGIYYILGAKSCVVFFRPKIYTQNVPPNLTPF